MLKIGGFRKPKKREEKVLNSALRYFKFDFKDCKILIRESNGKREVYLLSDDLVDFLEKSNIEFVIAGIKIGEIGKRLRLTLEGSFFVKCGKRVVLNEKGEMLFLYGRDVFSQSVVEVTPDVRENDLVFVCNLKNDVLGLGRSRFGAERFKSVERDRVVVENIIDRGEYLRKDRLYTAY